MKRIPLALTIGTSLALGAAQAQQAENAHSYAFQVGSIVATTISDGTFHAPPQPLYAPTADPGEVEAALRARGRPLDRMPIYFSPLLLQMGDRTVLIDGGAGRSLGPALGRLAERLQSLGVEPSAVDDILVTHAHLDHVGGLFDESGAATFPNARLHLHEAELRYWGGSPDLAGTIMPEGFKDNFRQTAAAALQAYAGRIVAFSWDDEVLPGITAFDLSGHTPGHAGFTIASDGERLLHVGDLFFDEAFDLAHPRWRTAFDSDPEAAAAARESFLAKASAERTRLFAYHIVFPNVGRVEVDGKGGYRWVPELWSFGPEG